MHGAAGPELSTIATGDALGVVGRVERATDGTVVIAIEDPAGITRVGDPIAGDPSAATTASGPAGSAGPELDREPVAAAVADPLAPEIGLAGIVLVGVASVAVTLLRRQRSQRLLAARVRARLDDLVRPVAGAGPEGPPDGLRQA